MNAGIPDRAGNVQTGTRFFLSLVLVPFVAWSGCKQDSSSDAGAGGSSGSPPVGAVGTASRSVARDKLLRIAIVPKGTTHEFWKAIHAGALKAEQELAPGVQITWKGPQKEDDREQQISVVENFITLQYDGIVLAPLSDKALLNPVRQARKAGIEVVIIDSDLAGEQGKDFASFVATDNYSGGEKAAQRLGEILGGKGKVLMMRYQVGSASTDERERGFLDMMKKSFAGIELVSTDQYGGATAESALAKAENLLNKYTEIDGIYTPNESSTFGMLRALQQSGRAGKVKFVGFDSSPKLIAALEAGEIHGLVLQKPMNMAYLGVKTIVRVLRGEKVEPRIDTGSVVATKENMKTPDIQELLTPPVDTYLK